MKASELRAWQRRCGLRRDKDAAAALGISVASYRRQRKGLTRIPRHTVLLAAYYEVYSLRWLAIAEAATALSRITPMPLAPAAVAAVDELITQVIRPTLGKT